MSDSQEIRDFEKKPDETQRVSAKARKQKSVSSSFYERETVSMLILFAAVVLAVISILIGVLVLHIQAVACCAIILLEAVIAACLLNVPVWLHGALVVIQLAAGVWQKNVLFIVLGVLVYLVAGYALRRMRRKY